MNPVAEEMKAIIDGDSLAHYGTKFHSGRYPYGSGEDPYQHGGDFLSRVEQLKKQGWKETAENVRNEFSTFIQSDMSDENLKNKYKPLLDFYEKVELDHRAYLSEIMDKQLSEEECLALVKKYNNHARVAPLYEEVVKFLKSLD
jgi:hypothetical protein